MAKVSLRIYTREIESIIEQGHIDEAIAHCRHILKTFPKHLETYRLLGKSYLEAKRYGEAVDIFSRLLMSVPDDFVAHVGMSIINDEQNQLDNAIWHMERAFETQPSNPAIQGELQRLYGRRDGVEPPRVRMTRGALAYMYVQGELYPQAIAEIRAVLAQDANRTDMQVLLALAQFKAGQKADASDMCSQLLKKAPYCFDANRIMVELLVSNAGTESTQVYRMRVGELDPYAIFSKGSIFQSTEVADAAVNLERLEYKGDEVPMGREWGSSLGIGAGMSSPALSGGSSSTEQPDWLKGMSASQPSPQPAATPPADDGIPDFLRQAGWGQASGPEQPTSMFDEPAPGAGIVSADIPDWLKGQMPDTPEPQQNDLPSSASMETPDWLSGLGGSTAASSASDVPDWLGGAQTPSAAPSFESSPAKSADTPDWLSGLGDAPANDEMPAVNKGTGELPDWLSGLGDAPSAGEPAQSETPDWLSGLNDENQETLEPASSNTPDWLSGLEDKPAQPAATTASVESLGSSAQEQDDAVAWLESLAAKHGAKPEELVTDPNKRSENAPEWVNQARDASQSQPSAAVPQSGPSMDDTSAWLNNLDDISAQPAANTPDWLSGLDDETSQPVAVNNSTTVNVENLGASASEQDDAVAWLESLAAKHGAKPEELVTDPNRRSENAPEWVNQARDAAQSQPEPVQPAANVPDWLSGLDEPAAQPVINNNINVENLGASAQEQDDAVAWLESLAAKHGAKPEELVTDPNKRSENAPEWVNQARDSAQSQPEPAKDDFSSNAANIGEEFFAQFEDAASAEPIKSQDENIDSNLPDWLSPAGEGQSTQSESEPAAQEDLSNWLSHLDDESDTSKTKDEPEWFAETSKLADDNSVPDWLNDLDDDVPQASKPAPMSSASSRTHQPAAVSLTADLPDWLQGVDDEPADDEMPEWMSKDEVIEDEEPKPKPVTPADWQPVEEVRKPAASRPIRPAPKPSAAAPKPSREPVYDSIDDEEAMDEEQPIVETRKPPVTPMYTKQPAQKPQSVAQQPAAKTPASQSAKTTQTSQPAEPKQSAPKRATKKSETQSSLREQAKGELDRGDIPAALEHYERLIKRGKHLEETISDLRESLYRYPVEVGIWQTLGDAYMRANRLKEALESYNKAEELIR